MQINGKQIKDATVDQPTLTASAQMCSGRISVASTETVTIPSDSLALCHQTLVNSGTIVCKGRTAWVV